MSDQELLRQDLSQMLKISAKQNPSDKATSAQLVKLLQTKNPFKSTLGSVYISRVQELSQGKEPGQCTCIVCRKNVTADGIFCESCFTKYTQGKYRMAALEPKASIPPVSTAPESHKNTWGYCQSCGAQLHSETCDRCGAKKGMGYAYCACCGNKVPLPQTENTGSVSAFEEINSVTSDIPAQAPRAKAKKKSKHPLLKIVLIIIIGLGLITGAKEAIFGDSSEGSSRIAKASAEIADYIGKDATFAYSIVDESLFVVKPDYPNVSESDSNPSITIANDVITSVVTTDTKYTLFGVHVGQSADDATRQMQKLGAKEDKFLTTKVSRAFYYQTNGISYWCLYTLDNDVIKCIRVSKDN